MTGTALTPLSPKEQAQLVNYNAAASALEKAVKIDDVKGIRDVSVAWRAYAAQAKDTKLKAWAAELQLRAERRAGEMLIAMAKSGERHPQGTIKGIARPRAGGEAGRGKKGSMVKYPKGTVATLADLGVTRKQSRAWQGLAKLPEKKFEEAVAEARSPRQQRKKIKINPAKQPVVSADAEYPGLERLQKAWFMATPEEGAMFLDWIKTNSTRKEIDR